MYFKKLDLHGFKSFADPVSIEFHKGITCIVGPNGSGKSNISDAIRWVLGEQSPKMLRGGKMEEVIFAGTANRKSRGMAEVTLVIDNTGGILPIDYAEVAITRRMYRSGESEYYINNNACRLRDIRELIMDTGIGVDGYSIIGQGKIAEIVNGKPESRREIFEEAAGIVKYRAKKAEAERKLAASSGNLERVRDIIGEIESRLPGLAEDSRKASEYLKLRERYQTLEINITLKNVETAEKRSDSIKEELAAAERYLAGLREQKAAQESEAGAYKNKSEELEQLERETQDKLLSASEEISRLVGDEKLAEEKLSAIERDRARLVGEAALAADKLELEKRNSVEFERQLAEVQAEAASLAGETERRAAALSSLTEEANAMEQELLAQKNRIFEWSGDMGAKRAERGSLDALRGTLKRRRDDLLQENQTSAEGSRTLNQALADAEAEQSAVKRAFDELEAEAAAKRERYAEANEREKTLSRSFAELQVAMGQIHARKKLLEELESSYDGYNNAVKFIMRREGLKGICGVVAELITVPEGYETAVETALGFAVQNVVTEDDRAAKEAVRELKQNRAGRLTFLPLSSIRSRGVQKDKNIEVQPGFKGYGAECVRVEEKYRCIAEYLLGRVVIVDDLDHAVAMSKKAAGGMRFVTLSGEIINSSGAITGGAMKHNTSNLLARKAEAVSLGERLRDMEQRQREAEKELAAARRDIAQLREDITELDTARRETERKLLGKENELRQYNLRLSDLEEARGKWKKELDSIESEEKESSDMIDALSKEIAEAEAKIAAMEKQIEERTGLWEEKKEEAAAAGESLTEARLAATEAEGRKTNILQLAQRIKDDICELERELAEKQNALSGLDIRERELRSGRTDYEKEIGQRERQKQELTLLLEKTQRDRGEVGKEMEAVEARKAETDQAIFSHQSRKHELDLKLAKNEAQVDGYKERLWEEFEISYLQAMEFEQKDFVMSQAVRESREIKNRMRELGDVNVGSIQEYAAVSERYEFLTGQQSDLLSAIDALNQIIEDMDKTIHRNFKESFDCIASNFETSFRELFGGGTAELRLEDERRPLECGVEIVAQPPGKKLQNINLMSGGEKTMTAIALMFAVLKAKPTPFCILDEVEAALDELNIQRFARYLKNFSEIQFALVTHQKATMEYADVMYGVTMPEQGISKVLSLRLGDDFDL